VGVELFITRGDASKPDYYSMTGATGWETVWLPAAAELGLDLIPNLGDGSFATVPPEYLPEVAGQLARLREWMAAHGHDLYVEHLDDILPALAAVDPDRRCRLVRITNAGPNRLTEAPNSQIGSGVLDCACAI
jgi:hypothetical protein